MDNSGNCDAAIGGGLVTLWAIGGSNSWHPGGWVVIAAATVVTTVVVVVAVGSQIKYYKDHTKNARNSTENKHQEGDARRKRDQGGEKKKQKDNWKGNPNKRRGVK